MKLNFIISKISNLFLFVLELSQLNTASNITKRGKEWIKRTGLLTNKDKRKIKSFSSIIKSQKAVNLDLVFILEKEKTIWKKAKKQIGIRKTKKLRGILFYFEKRFMKIWSEEQKAMKNIANYYSKEEGLISKIIKNVLNLCGVNNYRINKIPIHLLLNSKNKNDFMGWFSWTPRKSDIALECSGWPLKKTNKFLIFLLVHEFFHLILRKNKKIIALIKDVSRGNKNVINRINYGSSNTAMVLEELVISSFVPEGYLSEKYTRVSPKKQILPLHLEKVDVVSFMNIRKKIAFLMRDKACDYTENNKKIDSNYVEHLIKLIK